MEPPVPETKLIMARKWQSDWRERNRNKRIQNDTRFCIECGTSLKGMRGDAVVCSNSCRMKQYRKRKRNQL